VRAPLSARGEFDDAQLFNSAEMGVLLRVHTKTVARWHIASLRTLGGHHRYRREYLAKMIPAAGDPQLLHPAEVGEILNADRHTVCDWITRKQLRCWLLPSGRPRVARADVDLILAGRVDEVRAVMSR
jgi:hypothetical protein